MTGKLSLFFIMYTFMTNEYLLNEKSFWFADCKKCFASFSKFVVEWRDY